MASASDTTPLLADPEAQESGQYRVPQDGVINTPPQEKPPYFRPTIVLSHLSAALSIIAFIFDLTVICVDAANPGGYYLSWNLRGRLQGLFAISVLALVTSSLNLARLRHARASPFLWVNLIIDAVIVCYTVTLAPEALALNFDQSPSSWLPDNRAADTARAVIVLLGIGLIAGLIAGSVHLILFPIRCYASFVSGSWQSPHVWSIPSGEFRIEFSIKFLRKEDGRDSRGAE
ncbi:hypothetical protein BDW62DRAFT_174680 [Aspergillus aurantiobrunneus]